MKKYTLISFVIVFLGIFIPGIAHADTCQPIFGGGENCINSPIAIKKLVLNPQTNQLVDSLGIDDPKYHPGDIVTFQLRIATTGNATVSGVVVKDIFPQNFLFSDAPGTFDKITNTLTITIPTLSPNAPSINTIIGRIPASTTLPLGQTVVCQNNQASATVNNQTVNAVSQYCVTSTNSGQTSQTTSPTMPTGVTTTKGGLPVTFPVTNPQATPPTGNPTGFILGFASAVGMGIYLKKKAIKI